MAVRTINYTVNENGVSPETSQWGGIQYENNATRVSYTLEQDFKEKIEQNYPDGKKFVYRIDFDSSVAGYQPSENIEEEDGVISRDIPLIITFSGEPFQSTLVITVLDDELNEIATFCSKPTRIYFNSISREQYSGEELTTSISAMEETVTKMYEQVLASAADADNDAKTAHEAMLKTEQAKLSLESGSEIIFLGGDADSELNVEIAIDGALSETSENAVQNKVISNALKNYAKTDAVDAAIAQAIQDVVDEATSSAVATATQVAVEAALSEAKLAAHPVGSYYFSAEATDPSILFGGEWLRIKDRFILAAGDTYTVGETGGEAEVTLTEGQLPNITGIIANVTTQTAGGVTCRGVFSPRAEGAGNKMLYGGGTQATTTAENTDEIQMSFGEDQPHNNMPPYIVAYCWQRIA
ncbi:MAG: hypothetical protein E7531_03640 [Ruminococcaceae bacterium]|nr:hypothetical protein [Oscillospiraceae bacterium]